MHFKVLVKSLSERLRMHSILLVLVVVLTVVRSLVFFSRRSLIDAHVN